MAEVSERVALDPDVARAGDVLIAARRVSGELLKRKLEIRTGLADALIDQLETVGLVSAELEGKRTLLLSPTQWEDLKNGMPNPGSGPQARADLGSDAPMEQPQTSAEALAVELVPLDTVYESPNNPRKTFDPVKMAELKADLARNGQQEPAILYPPDADGRSELFEGARRFRNLVALVSEGHSKATMFLKAIRTPRPASEVDDAFARLSRFNREGLTPLDEARAYKRLVDLGVSVGQIVENLGGSVRHVEQRIALLDLAAPVLEDLAKGLITASHADEIARLPESKQIPALAACTERHLSVRGLKEYLKERGWTKTAERESDEKAEVGEGQHADGADAAADEGAGTPDGSDASSDGNGAEEADTTGVRSAGGDGEDEAERTAGGADVIGEAQRDLDRQNNAAAYGEQKAAERKANDGTPDAETAKSQADTEETKLRDATREAIAYRAVRLIKINKVMIERELTFHASHLRDFGDATTPKLVDKVRNSFYYQITDPVNTLGDAAAVILALNFQRAIDGNYPQSWFEQYVTKLKINVDECVLDARAEMLGVTVAEVRRMDEAKRAAEKPAKKPRADKGKARPSPKVAKKARAEKAKKISAVQIKKNIAAAKKPKAKAKKK